MFVKKCRIRRCITPSGPNQPSESISHFLFELAKTLLTKAGGKWIYLINLCILWSNALYYVFQGTHSTTVFLPSGSGGPSNQHNNHTNGAHRALHLCAFQVNKNLVKASMAKISFNAFRLAYMLSA